MGEGPSSGQQKGGGAGPVRNRDEGFNLRLIEDIVQTLPGIKERTMREDGEDLPP